MRLLTLLLAPTMAFALRKVLVTGANKGIGKRIATRRRRTEGKQQAPGKTAQGATKKGGKAKGARRKKRRGGKATKKKNRDGDGTAAEMPAGLMTHELCNITDNVLTLALGGKM